jgi:hypothetical protein
MYFRGTGGLPVFMPDGENLGARDLNTIRKKQILVQAPNHLVQDMFA